MLTTADFSGFKDVLVLPFTATDLSLADLASPALSIQEFGVLSTRVLNFLLQHLKVF